MVTPVEQDFIIYEFNEEAHDVSCSCKVFQFVFYLTGASEMYRLKSKKTPRGKENKTSSEAAREAAVTLLPGTSPGQLTRSGPISASLGCLSTKSCQSQLTSARTRSPNTQQQRHCGGATRRAGERHQNAPSSAPLALFCRFFFLRP